MKKNEQASTAEIIRLEDVPEGGSLGLLALGYQGLMLWRASRKQLMEQQAQNTAQNEEA